MAFDLSLEKVGAQKVVKRKMNFPSRRNSMFRRKTLLKLYRILELISSRGDHIFLTDKIFLSH